MGLNMQHSRIKNFFILYGSLNCGKLDVVKMLLSLSAPKECKGSAIKCPDAFLET
jgi:hypothetical protein